MESPGFVEVGEAHWLQTVQERRHIGYTNMRIQGGCLWFWICGSCHWHQDTESIIAEAPNTLSRVGMDSSFTTRVENGNSFQGNNGKICSQINCTLRNQACQKGCYLWRLMRRIQWLTPSSLCLLVIGGQQKLSMCEATKGCSGGESERSCSYPPTPFLWSTKILAFIYFFLQEVDLWKQEHRRGSSIPLLKAKKSF